MPSGRVVLQRASMTPPPGLRELLDDLGAGESGFGGTPVHRGECTLEEYLRRCSTTGDPGKLQPGRVPQTVLWVLDAAGQAVGMVRLRHALNDQLRVRGGHIGYYVRRDQRGRGYATDALRQALVRLAALGERRALLTVDADNPASIKVIEANGGRWDSTDVDAETGKPFHRYWIDLEPSAPNEAAGVTPRTRS